MLIFLIASKIKSKCSVINCGDRGNATIFLSYDESGTPGESFQPHGGNSMILDNCHPDSPVLGVHILREKKKLSFATQIVVKYT